MQIQQQTTFILEDNITNEQQQYFDKYGAIHFKNFIDKNTISVFIDEIKKYLLEQEQKRSGGFSAFVDNKPVEVEVVPDVSDFQAYTAY